MGEPCSFSDGEEKGDNEEEMIPPKLGDMQEPPPLPSTHDSNSQTQNSMVIYENPCYYDESNNAPLLILASNTTSTTIDDNEECCLDMLYDNSLDDGPALLDYTPCLTMITNSYEDRYNDKLPTSQDDTLIHESPIPFLNSPIYTIEEKYALCEKYMHGLKLSYGNPTCNHDVNDDVISRNYFKIGNHAHDFHNKLNNPLYVPINSKLHSSQDHIVEFAFHACNYYERGGDKCSLYAFNNYKLHSSTDNIRWYALIYCDLFIYKMPMHRKKIRLRCYLIYASWCVLSCFKVLNILIGLITPWDPGILLSCFLSNNEKGRIKKHYSHNICPSYMAIKKVLYGRQPSCFVFGFYLDLLLLQESFIFVFFLEFSIKCQVLPIWMF